MANLRNNNFGFPIGAMVAFTCNSSLITNQSVLTAGDSAHPSLHPALRKMLPMTWAKGSKQARNKQPTSRENGAPLTTPHQTAPYQSVTKFPGHAPPPIGNGTDRANRKQLLVCSLHPENEYASPLPLRGGGLGGVFLPPALPLPRFMVAHCRADRMRGDRNHP